MKKIFLTIFACLMAILVLTLTACDKDKNGTYYPTNEEMKTNLESNGYFVETYPNVYMFDGENGETVRYIADTVRATNSDDYICFCRIDKAQACDYYFNVLRDTYPDAEVFVRIENDKNFGNIVYCGTENAINASGIKIVEVKVNV